MYPGLSSAAPIKIAGIFRPDDTNGQIAILTDQLSKTSERWLFRSRQHFQRPRGRQRVMCLILRQTT